jgi:hypothetical protein
MIRALGDQEYKRIIHLHRMPVPRAVRHPRTPPSWLLVD